MRRLALAFTLVALPAAALAQAAMQPAMPLTQPQTGMQPIIPPGSNYSERGYQGGAYSEGAYQSGAYQSGEYHSGPHHDGYYHDSPIYTDQERKALWFESRPTQKDLEGREMGRSEYRGRGGP